MLMLNMGVRSVCTECVGYLVDYSNYMSSIAIMASSNSATAPNALAGGTVWTASADDVDADGDFVYSVVLTSSKDSYLASIRVDVANVAVILLYVQCREKPGRWFVATAPVCHVT